MSDWLWVIVDILASEYGWTKKDILYDTYLNEIVELIPKIQSRRIQNYRLQLAIIQNPHTKNPEELWNMLDDLDMKPRKKKTLDEVGIELLKTKLQQSPHFVVK